MAVDKLVDSTQLDADLTSVADAIRTKGGTSSSLAFPAGFVSAIDAIETGGGGSNVEYGTYTPTERTMSHTITTTGDWNNFAVFAGEGFSFSLGSAAMVLFVLNGYGVGTNNGGTATSTIGTSQGTLTKSGKEYTYAAKGSLSASSRCWQAGVTYHWIAW